MTAGTQTDSDFAFAGLATPEVQATEAIKSLAAGPDPPGPGQASWARGRAMDSTPSGGPTTPPPAGSLPRAEQDRRDAGVHQDQRADPQPGAGDAGPRHVRGDIPAADQRVGHPRRPPHRAGHLGGGAPDERPGEPPTVVRMASIPHGTTILAQGVAQVLAEGLSTSRTTTSCRYSSAPLRPRTATSIASPRRSQSSTCPIRPISPGAPRGDAGHRQEPQQRAQAGTRVLASGHEHEEQDVPARRDRTAPSRPAAAPPTPRSWPPAAIPPRATPGPPTQRRRSGSKRSPGRGQARHAPAAVHAARDARLQRHPLAARDRRDAAQAVGHQYPVPHPDQAMADRNTGLRLKPVRQEPIPRAGDSWPAESPRSAARSLVLRMPVLRDPDGAAHRDPALRRPLRISAPVRLH